MSKPWRTFFTLAVHLPNCKPHTHCTFVSEEKVLMCPVSLFQTKGFVLLLYSIQLQHFEDYDTLWGRVGEVLLEKRKRKKEVQSDGQAELVFLQFGAQYWTGCIPCLGGSAGIVLCVHNDEVVVEFKEVFQSVFSPAFLLLLLLLLLILIKRCFLTRVKLTVLYKQLMTKTTLTYIS